RPGAPAGRLRPWASGRCCRGRRSAGGWAWSCSALHAAAGALEVFGRVDAGREGFGCDADGDAVAGFEHAQLFQGFNLFELAGWHGGEAAQEAGAIGVDADVPQPGTAGRHGAAVGGEGIAGPGDGRAAEVEVATAGGAHELDGVGVEEVRGVFDGGGQGGHGGAGFDEGGGDGADAGGGGEGFVALEVDDDGVVAPAGDVGAFGEAVGAGLVVGRGHGDLDAAAVEGVGDALVVGGDAHFAGAGGEGAAGDVQDHGVAGDRLQGFAGEAGGGVAGGDGDYEVDWGGHGVILAFPV